MSESATAKATELFLEKAGALAGLGLARIQRRVNSMSVGK
jgi:hypothetical protein